jgi:hypothetical protein
MTVTSIDFGPSAAQLWASRQQDKYAFVSNERDGLYYLLLVDTAVLASGVQFVPLALMEFATPEQLAAAWTWVGERCEQWQDWGRLGAASYAELHAHLADLLRTEPMEMAFMAYQLSVDPKRRTISLGRLMANHVSTARIELWTRSYKSRAQYIKACRWFDENTGNLAALDEQVTAHGPAVIDAAIAA